MERLMETQTPWHFSMDQLNSAVLVLIQKMPVYMVEDIPAEKVVSIGLRGSYGKKTFLRGYEKLNAWLANHPEWKVAGSPRTLGYNSPMVPSFMKFSEVQIPVVAARSGTVTNPGKSCDDEKQVPYTPARMLDLLCSGSDSDAPAWAQQPPFDMSIHQAEPPYYRVRYEASTEPGELIFPVNYTIWIPPKVKTATRNHCASAWMW